MRTFRSLAAAVVLLAALVVAPDVVAYNGAVLLPCPFVNQGPVDPIVHPGMPGDSHNHDFFGGGPVTAASTPTSLRAGATTCQIKSDHAAYWVPSMVRKDGTVARPTGFSVYYRAAQAATATQTVQVFPSELRFVSGNPANTNPYAQPANWRCGNNPSAVAKSIPATCGGSGLQMTLPFARCWDGVTMSGTQAPSPYVRFGNADGTCPASHPVVLPQLTYIVNYGPDAEGGRLASDVPGAPAGSSVHGDFMNGWDQASQQRLVTGCLNVNDPTPSSQSCRFSGNTVVTNPDGVFVTS